MATETCSRQRGRIALMALILLGCSPRLTSSQHDEDAGGADDAMTSIALFGDGGLEAFAAGTGSDVSCGLQKYKLSRLAPEVLLVLDRSGSMVAEIPNSKSTRWTEVTAAMDDILMKTQDSIAWGLETFPTNNLCTVAPDPEVLIGAGNYTPITTYVNMATTVPNGGGTPTAMAMENATAYLATRTTKNPKYIVLATDGEPYCGGSTVARSVSAIAAAAAAGYDTFVIGISIDAATDAVLNMMAVAGGEARSGAKRYYPAMDRADLGAVLGSIAGTIMNCKFALDQTPPSPDDVAVKADGARINRDANHNEGWDYSVGGKSIEIYGSICDRLKSGTVEGLEITYGCPGVLIP